MSRTFRCLTAVLILALLAGAGAAQALPVAKGPDTVRFESPLVQVWGWVVAIAEKAGSFIDPNGDSLQPMPDPVSPADSTTSSDAGSFIDPNGNS